MSRDKYEAQKQAINAGYRSSRAGCDALSSNARALCAAEAMGKAQIAKAELEALYQPGPTTLYKARFARSDATYSVAWQQCNNLAGTLKNVCIHKARSAETIAMAGAKTVPVSRWHQVQ